MMGSAERRVSIFLELWLHRNEAEVCEFVKRSHVVERVSLSPSSKKGSDKVKGPVGTIRYSPVILFTEHWLFFLFLFGPLSHLREKKNRNEGTSATFLHLHMMLFELEHLELFWVSAPCYSSRQFGHI